MEREGLVLMATQRTPPRARAQSHQILPSTLNTKASKKDQLTAGQDPTIQDVEPDNNLDNSSVPHVSKDPNLTAANTTPVHLYLKGKNRYRDPTSWRANPPE